MAISQIEAYLVLVTIKSFSTSKNRNYILEFFLLRKGGRQIDPRNG